MADFHAGVDSDGIVLRGISGGACHAADCGCFLGQLSTAGDKRNDCDLRSGGRIRVANGMQYVQKQAAIIFGKPGGIVQRPQTIGPTP